MKVVEMLMSVVQKLYESWAYVKSRSSCVSGLWIFFNKIKHFYLCSLSSLNYQVLETDSNRSFPSLLNSRVRFAMEFQRTLPSSLLVFVLLRPFLRCICFGGTFCTPLKCRINFLMAQEWNDLSLVSVFSTRITLGKYLDIYTRKIITTQLFRVVVRLKWGKICKSLVGVNAWYIAGA